jgi:hypothetical protein
VSRLAIVAEPADSRIAGLRGTQAWGEAATLSADNAAGLAAFQPDVVLALGDAPLPLAPAGRLVRWWEDAPAGTDYGVLQLAPRGDGLWSRAPWPVNDDLFMLAPSDGPPEALLVGGTEERREDLLGKLTEREVRTRVRDELAVSYLTRAAAVILLGEDDEALPARAMAVLAARRVLIAPRCRVTFGLQPGIEFLGCDYDDDAMEWARVVVAHPEAFDSLRAMGALAAERHRASTAYGRLALDLQLAA